MARDFKGVWIPKEIWLNEELSLQEKVFLTEIDSLDNEDGCFASNGYFAQFFGLSKGRCSQVISGLEKKGLISIKYVYSKENPKEIDKRIINCGVKYFKEGIKNAKGGSKYPKGGYLENDKGNNTSINNTINNNIYKGKFKKPTVDEIKTYCDERENKVDPQHFYDFYESKGWLVGKNKMKDWKACVRTWERNNFEKSRGFNKQLPVHSRKTFLDLED